MTAEDKQRIKEIRMRMRVRHRKACYYDDTRFLLRLVGRLLDAVEELKRENERLKEKFNDQTQPQ